MEILELCNRNAEYLENGNALYELNGSLTWIKDIIIQCNRLGFLTHTSQPGKIVQTVIYKSAYHRLYDQDSDNILRTGDVPCTNGIRMQRAYIHGYMSKSMADYIVKGLSKHEFLFIRAEHLPPRVADFEIKLGSVIFYEGKPVAKTMLDVKCREDLKSVPDSDASYNFALPLRRPFSFMKKELLGKFGVKEEEITSSSDIVEFDILDTRWNQNDFLWKVLLDAIISSRGD